MGHLLRVRPHAAGEHDLQRPVGVDAPLLRHHRVRGGARQEPAQDEHAAPAGRHHARVRGHWQADALLRKEGATGGDGAEDRCEWFLLFYEDTEFRFNLESRCNSRPSTSTS